MCPMVPTTSLNSSVVLGVDLFFLLKVEDWANGPTEDTLCLAGEEARLNGMLSGAEDDEGMSNGIEEVGVIAAMESTRCMP